MAVERMNLARFAELREAPGRVLGLFLTDRCPVGCAHCSVDSRRDSPTVTDFALLDALLDGICARPGVAAVAITGGEPFVERRALTRAVERLAEAGKALVLFTSGVWATAERPPAWIARVLRRASCVFLSTDAYHAGAVGDDRFVRAARAIAAEGAWLIVQVLDRPEMLARAGRLLGATFGEAVDGRAELSPIAPLPYGRGAALFRPGQARPGHAFGTCTILSSPLVRYDGWVSACCNERVIMGRGPARLRRHCRSADALGEALDAFAADPLLRALARAGAGPLTCHPRFADLASASFSSICDLCWTMQARSPAVPDHSDRVLELVGGDLLVGADSAPVVVG